MQTYFGSLIKAFVNVGLAQEDPYFFLLDLDKNALHVYQHPDINDINDTSIDESDKVSATASKGDSKGSDAHPVVDADEAVIDDCDSLLEDSATSDCGERFGLVVVHKRTPFIFVIDLCILQRGNAMIEDALKLTISQWQRKWLSDVRQFWPFMCQGATDGFNNSAHLRDVFTGALVDSRDDLSRVVEFVTQWKFYQKQIEATAVELKRNKSPDDRLAYEPTSAASFALVVQKPPSSAFAAVCLAHSATPVPAKLPKKHHITSLLNDLDLDAAQTSFVCINFLLVDPAFRGRGIGHLLVAKLIHLSLAAAPTRPVLAYVEVNAELDKGAESFWRREGFNFRKDDDGLLRGHRVYLADFKTDDVDEPDEAAYRAVKEFAAVPENQWPMRQPRHVIAHSKGLPARYVELEAAPGKEEKAAPRSAAAPSGKPIGVVQNMRVFPDGSMRMTLVSAADSNQIVTAFVPSDPTISRVRVVGLCFLNLKSGLSQEAN